MNGTKLTAGAKGVLTTRAGVLMRDRLPQGDARSGHEHLRADGSRAASESRGTRAGSLEGAPAARAWSLGIARALGWTHS